MAREHEPYQLDPWQSLTKIHFSSGGFILVEVTTLTPYSYSDTADTLVVGLKPKVPLYSLRGLRWGYSDPGETEVGGSYFRDPNPSGTHGIMQYYRRNDNGQAGFPNQNMHKNFILKLGAISKAETTTPAGGGTTLGGSQTPIPQTPSGEFEWSVYAFGEYNSAVTIDFDMRVRVYGGNPTLFGKIGTVEGPEVGSFPESSYRFKMLGGFVVTDKTFRLKPKTSPWLSGGALWPTAGLIGVLSYKNGNIGYAAK